MKAILRKWVLVVLRFLAKRRLKQIKPAAAGAGHRQAGAGHHQDGAERVTVVGITGSAGKTSGKQAIYEVLSRRYSVRKSEKNMNTEFGTVLTVLGQKSGYSSAGKWMRILLKALWDSFKKPEPYDVLVLEMGVDKPGDMDEILATVVPDIMVFTNVKNVHLGRKQFANRQAIFEEKQKACLAVSPSGWVILNMDDPFVRQLKDKLPARTLTIGTEEGCDLQAKDVEAGPEGLRFTLIYEDQSRLVTLPHVLGASHVTVALVAIAVGFLQGVPWKAIELALCEYRLPPGRMNKIEGKNGSVLIDSSYNALPDTMEAALEILKDFPGQGGGAAGRRIAALGTMNELGELSESEHIKIGKMAAGSADMLLAVGEHAKDLVEGAKRGGMPLSAMHIFKTSKEAGQFLSNILERGDTVLVKGSQNNVRMEQLMKLCMKEPDKARMLLIRQDPYWLTRS